MRKYLERTEIFTRGLFRRISFEIQNCLSSESSRSSYNGRRACFGVFLAKIFIFMECKWAVTSLKIIG